MLYSWKRRDVSRPKHVYMLKPIFILALVNALGCASSLLKDPPRTDEEYYQRAQDYLDDGLEPEAIQILSVLKVRFPYSRFVALADLRIADIQFDQGQYVEATDSYRNFLKYNPKHDRAPYAMLQIAKAYREQIPSDIFFLPPVAEKDQASTRLAITAYKDMLARFPNTEYNQEARRELDQCRAQLAKHEIYVARFYHSRDKWKAAAGRADGLLRDFAGLGFDREALLIASESHFELGEYDRALVTASRLQNEFPGSDEAQETAKLLESLKAKVRANAPKPPAG